MSKLAHSNQETMDEIERKRAIENGDEDLIAYLTPLQRFQPRSMVDVLWSKAAEERRLAAACRLTDGARWEDHRSKAILFEQEAWAIQTFGARGAYLRQRVLTICRRHMDGKQSLPFGIVSRLHKALEPKPLYASKRSICWGRYVEAERTLSGKPWE